MFNLDRISFQLHKMSILLIYESLIPTMIAVDWQWLHLGKRFLSRRCHDLFYFIFLVDIV